MILTLAEEIAKASETFLGLSVASWILLLTTIGAGITALLKWIEARASKREAHELALAKLVVEKERDAMIEGVERVGDKLTKASIKKTALERGVNSLDSSVKRATGHIRRSAELILACALIAGLGGCYAQARSDAVFYSAINAGHASDASISTDARAVAADNRDAWAVQAWQLGGDKPPPEVFERLGLEDDQ